MMPSKKKKYNARFPAGRIKKIMQTDDDVGKVAQPVPIIISRALELFVESLLTKTVEVTNAKNAKTLTPSHMKQCILSESRFDFLKDLVNEVSDVSTADDDGPLSVPSSEPLTNPIPPPLKRESSGRGRGRGKLSMRLNASCPPTSATSLKHRKSVTSSHPTTPNTPTVTALGCPSFYKETQISSGMFTADANKESAVSRPPVIQHTGSANVSAMPIDSGDEEEEEEEEQERNGYEIYNNHSSRSLLIDDDYDT